MKNLDEVQVELDTAREHAHQLAQAVTVARARYQAALSAKADLSALDADQLAAGVGVNLDVQSALVAVRELERRLRDAQDAVTVLRQEHYHAATQSAIEDYVVAVDALMLAARDLAAEIEEAQAIIADVKPFDARVFRLSRLFNELSFTVDTYQNWRGPRVPRGSWRLAVENGRIVHLQAEEFERRERERLDQMRPKQRTATTSRDW
jgi:hypothetical protein